MARRTGDPRWRSLTSAASDHGRLLILSRGTRAPESLPELMPVLIADIQELDWFHLATGGEGRRELPDDGRLALSSVESRTYLRNQLLRDSDWASMAHGLELRTPLVDAQLLARLGPVLGQLQDFPRKSLLSGAPLRPLPAAVAGASKTGFSVPLVQWMRDLTQGDVASMREWAAYVVARYDDES